MRAKIIHRNTHVYDLDATLAFYEKALGLTDTLKAVDFAVAAHEGQTRKKSDVPYIYHPLNLACHALAMNITDDAVISCCLLHDVIEDCGKTAEELPVRSSSFFSLTLRLRLTTAMQ